jgi:CBS domain-containing protein
MTRWFSQLLEQSDRSVDWQHVLLAPRDRHLGNTREKDAGREAIPQGNAEASEELCCGQHCNRGASVMRKNLYKSGAALGLALVSPAALAATEDVLTILSEMQTYGFIVFVILVSVIVYFTTFRDKRRVPVTKIFDEGEPIHAVRPDTSVTECVRLMTAEKIGALIVLDGERLVGMFTERDALNKVLAAGLDPGNTKVAEVMTKNLIWIPPTTTVGEAMELITRRRFRHLPIVDNGKVLAVISSGDLTHWLVQDKIGEVRELVDLTARS